MNNGRRTRNARGAGDLLRGEVVAAAAALIAEEGRDALTLRGIARRAGITAPSIYAHFDGLDAVRAAVVADMFDDFADHLRTCEAGLSEPVDRLRALCRGYVQFGRAHASRYAVMFSDAADAPPLGPDKTIENMAGATAFGILLAAICDCAEVGASASPDHTEAAIAMWVGLHGFVGLHAAAPDFPWPPDEKLLDVLIDRLVLIR